MFFFGWYLYKICLFGYFFIDVIVDDFEMVKMTLVCVFSILSKLYVFE